MDIKEVVTQIEALTVAPDETLVIKFPEGMDEFLDDMNRRLQMTQLRDRFVLFAGDVQFAKVQKKPDPEILMSDIAE